MQIPDDRRYSQDHEWALVEDGKVRVGITDYAQEALGDVVYVQLPDIGTAVTAGESLGEVESTKSVSDVYAPLSGEVTEINEAVSETPELINEDPYEAGWLVRVRLSNPSEADGLMDAEAYKGFLKESGD